MTTPSVKEQDLLLPFENVTRTIKIALPEDAKISKDAKECMQECVSEFISFITSEAVEKTQRQKRKTVNGEDILLAMRSLGFENYAEALKIYHSKYFEDRNRSLSSGQNMRGPISRGGGVDVPNAVGRAGDTVPPENPNSILKAKRDPNEQDNQNYPFSPRVGATHNGTGGKTYY